MSKWIAILIITAVCAVGIYFAVVNNLILLAIGIGIIGIICIYLILRYWKTSQPTD
jgi:cyanate permease